MSLRRPCGPAPCAAYATHSLTDIQRELQHRVGRSTIRYWLTRLQIGTKINQRHHLTVHELQRLKQAIGGTIAPPESAAAYRSSRP